MVDLTLPPFDAIVTREVRWFRAGTIPSPILDWFTSASANIETEARTDWYDAGYARDGVGMKCRGTAAIDVKFRVMVTDTVHVAPGMTGSIEDWIKTSAPVSDPSEDREHHHLGVAKSIMTRRYPSPGVAMPESGCEAELVSIAVGGHVAWSLCFETFGGPEDRIEAFESGVQMFIADTPLPDGVTFTADESRSYPDWISHMIQSA